ncbi:chitinase [Streptomyces odontomachi]|uniref:chitinase n=1 Tax=Streptomyces odontomachi TaxID=2944940 RepID=UPI0027E2DC4C|nr:chitinase [Streptomyces sp. ODS25]
MTSTHRRTVSGAIKAMRGLATAGMVACGGFLFSATALATPTAAPVADTAKATGGAFAPYVDTSLAPAYDLVATASQTGVRDFTLAFVTAGGGCTPLWGGTGDLNSNDVASQIDDLRAEGGDVRVSFGGATGTELASACPDAGELAAAYGKVIDAYRLTKVDFDIEGASLTAKAHGRQPRLDPAVNTRRAQAIARLQKDHPDLDVSFTLPVLPEGLTRPGVDLLADARKNGVAVSTVNIMAMDYGPTYDGDMAQYAERAATATQAQLGKALGLSEAAAWHAVAITPMIGVNDVGGEVFTVDDATELVSFAQRHGAGWLAMWSATRDQPCKGGSSGAAQPDCSSIDQEPLAFTNAFGAYR